MRELLNSWIHQARQDGWRFDYAVSLSSTALHHGPDTSLDFTVLDQIRLVKYFETTRVFAYLGGFLDPLLKNTVDKSSDKVYLSGVGFGWQSVFVALSAGIEYPNVAIKNTRIALSFGYEIPIGDVLE